MPLFIVGEKPLFSLLAISFISGNSFCKNDTDPSVEQSSEIIISYGKAAKANALKSGGSIFGSSSTPL